MAIGLPMPGSYSPCPACGMYDPCLCRAGVFNGTRSTPQAPHGSALASAYAQLAATQAAQLRQASANRALQNALGSAQQALGSPGVVSYGDLLTISRYPPVEPLEKAGTSFEEFVGWRIWQIKDGYLASYSSEYVWAPGEPAQGEPGDHDQAGLWAFKDKGKALHKLIGQSTTGVMGSVWLYGDVVEHAIGYRAQYATVRSLDEAVVREECREAAKWIPGVEWLAKRVAKRAVLAALRETYEVPA